MILHSELAFDEDVHTQNDTSKKKIIISSHYANVA